MVGDYPSRIPMIDVVSVGGGGGSIAWISPEGTLTVGPRSAGADPGPICYGTGGTEPTVTDAHVVLGRIPPRLLGGGIPLDAGAARAGLEQLGATLGLDAEATARGILEISAWNQAHALRQISVQRGLDVRDFVLATFGGSGSLLACRLAGILGLAGVVVPLDPGTVSAYGLLTVDVRTDHVRTAVQRDDALDLRRVAAVYAELELAALGALAAEGFAAGDGQLVRTADLRYAGQAYEVRVTAPGGPVDAAFARAVAGAFHAGHRARYGYAFEGRADQAVEWVNLRVTGIGPIERPRRGGVSMSLSSRRGGGVGGGDGGPAVGLAVAEHGEQDVGAASGKADQGGVVALARGPLAVVVGPAGGVAQTGECRQEQGALEGVVAALGAGLALDRGAGASGDGSQAGVGGQVPGGGER
jgi:N-methylhydantoinase A